MAHKLVSSIFISICLIFAMSYNANATTLTMPVQYNRDLTSIGATSRCAVQNGPFVSLSGNTCVWGTNVGGDLQGRGLSFFETGYAALTYTMYYEIYLTVGMTSEAQLMIPVIWSPSTTANFHLVDYEQVSVNENIGSSATNEAYTATYRFILRPVNSGWQRLQLGDDNRLNNFIYLGGDPWSVVVDTRVESIMEYKVVDDSASTQQIVEAINELKESNQEQAQQEREELEQAQENLNDVGESSQGSVESSTQNLMSAGASIISALSNAPATDCNINMTTSGSSSAFTGAIGSVNLCSGVPSGVLTMVQGIVALVFTPIVLYYTYSIITTIYKQFKEYNS